MSGPLRCLIVDVDQKPIRLVSVPVFPGTELLNVKETVLEKAGIESGLTNPVV